MQLMNIRDKVVSKWTFFVLDLHRVIMNHNFHSVCQFILRYAIEKFEFHVF